MPDRHLHAPSRRRGDVHLQVQIEDTSNGLKTTCEIEVEVKCRIAPECYFTEDGPIEVAVGEEIDFEFCGVTACDGARVRVEMSSRPPFIDPAGHQKGGVDQTVCLPIKGTPGPEDVGYWRVRITTRDLDTGVETECDIQIIVTGPGLCDDRPVCSITPESEIIALPGDSITIEACGASLCDDGTAMIELIGPPPFCDTFEPVISAPGEQACAELVCDIPLDAEPGEHLVRFRITDMENDRFTFCETTIIIEDPASQAFCVEEEPNDTPAACTQLDADECLNFGNGAIVVGLLDITGDDLDYYCLSGFEPFTDYLVTVVGGIDCDGEPVCAALACIDENGGVINASNSGGVMPGYPSIECASDADGFIRFAVSGCDDLNFDGVADNPEDNAADRGGIGHGSTGSYQLTIAPLNPTALDLACQADMNGDGVIDSADLGMLIGIFGENCAP